MRKFLAYLKRHRSAVLATIVVLQNAGLLSEKAGGLLTAVAGM